MGSLGGQRAAAQPDARRAHRVKSVVVLCARALALPVDAPAAARWQHWPTQVRGASPSDHRQAFRKCPTPWRCRHVWVVEDDTVFVGDVREAFMPFGNASADLVAVFQPHPYIDDEAGLHINPAFSAALPGHQPLHKRGQHVKVTVYAVVSLSARLQAAPRGVFGTQVGARRAVLAGTAVQIGGSAPARRGRLRRVVCLHCVRAHELVC